MASPRPGPGGTALPGRRRAVSDASPPVPCGRLGGVGGRFRRVRRGGAESDFEAARRSRNAAASGECGVDLFTFEFGLAVAVAIRSSLSVDLPGAARRRWGVAVAARPLALSRTPIPNIYPPGNPRNPSEFKGRALHGALVGSSCRAGSAARPSPIYRDPPRTRQRPSHRHGPRSRVHGALTTRHLRAPDSIVANRSRGSCAAPETFAQRRTYSRR